MPTLNLKKAWKWMWSQNKNLYWAVGTGILVVAVSCYFILTKSRLTENNLAKIKVGMTLDEVQHVLGQPNEQKTQGALNLTGTTYTYRQGKAEVRIVFINNHVMQKEGQVQD